MPEPPVLPAIASEAISVVLLASPHSRETKSVLDAWVAYLGSLGSESEIIVVGPGVNELPSCAASGAMPVVRSLVDTAVLPVGPTLHRGIAEARFPLLVLADSKSGYLPCDLKLLLDAIDKVHLAVGVPSSAGRLVKRTRQTWLYHIFLRWVFGIRLRYVDCAFQLFRREIFARIPIQSQGPFAHAEILAKANFLGCVISEVPILWMPPPMPPKQGFDWTSRRRDAWRVFHHPDFGPTVIPTPAQQVPPADQDPAGEPPL